MNWADIVLSVDNFAYGTRGTMKTLNKAVNYVDNFKTLTFAWIQACAHFWQKICGHLSLQGILSPVDLNSSKHIWHVVNSCIFSLKSSRCSLFYDFKNLKKFVITHEITIKIIKTRLMEFKFWLSIRSLSFCDCKFLSSSSWLVSSFPLSIRFSVTSFSISCSRFSKWCWPESGR